MRLSIFTVAIAILGTSSSAHAEVGPRSIAGDAECADKPIDTVRGKRAFMSAAIERAELLRTSSSPLGSGATASRVWIPSGPDSHVRSLDGASVQAFLWAHRTRLGGEHLAHVSLAESFPTEAPADEQYFRFVQKVPGVRCDCEARIFVRRSTLEVTRVESSMVDVPPNVPMKSTLRREQALVQLRGARPELDIPPDDDASGLPELLANDAGETRLTWVFRAFAVCVAAGGGRALMGSSAERVAIDAHDGTFRGYVQKRPMMTPVPQKPRAKEPAPPPCVEP